MSNADVIVAAIVAIRFFSSNIENVCYQLKKTFALEWGYWSSFEMSADFL